MMQLCEFSSFFSDHWLHFGGYIWRPVASQWQSLTDLAVPLHRLLTDERIPSIAKQLRIQQVDPNSTLPIPGLIAWPWRTLNCGQVQLRLLGEKRSGRNMLVTANRESAVRPDSFWFGLHGLHSRWRREASVGHVGRALWRRQSLNWLNSSWPFDRWCCPLHFCANVVRRCLPLSLVRNRSKTCPWASRKTSAGKLGLLL